MEPWSWAHCRESWCTWILFATFVFGMIKIFKRKRSMHNLFKFSMLKSSETSLSLWAVRKCTRTKNEKHNLGDLNAYLSCLHYWQLEATHLNVLFHYIYFSSMYFKRCVHFSLHKAWISCVCCTSVCSNEEIGWRTYFLSF